MDDINTIHVKLKLSHVVSNSTQAVNVINLLFSKTTCNFFFKIFFCLKICTSPKPLKPGLYCLQKVDTGLQLAVLFTCSLHPEKRYKNVEFHTPSTFGMSFFPRWVEEVQGPFLEDPENLLGMLNFKIFIIL